MAKNTFAARTFRSYTFRSNTWAGPASVTTGDYLCGELHISLAVTAEMTIVSPAMLGELSISEELTTTLTVSASVLGDMSVAPAMSGTLEVNPC